MGLWFWEKLERWGDRTALCGANGRDISYRELAEMADAMAAQFGNDRQLVLIEAANTVPSVVALLTCLRGRHPVILSTAGSSARIVETFRPNFVVDERGGVTRLHEAPYPLHDDLCLMLSTSGSTGTAKLVRLSHEAVHANASAIAQYLDIDETDIPVTTLPITYSYGLSVVTSHLASGAGIVLTGLSVIDDDFWTLVATRGVTSLAGVPYTYELLESRGFRTRSTPTLRTLTQAGGKLSSELRAQYAQWAPEHGIRFFVMYGQTEATARMAYLPPEYQGAHGDCIGQAIPGGALSVEDEAGSRLPLGQAGELVYEGPNVMLGYATAPADLAKGREIERLRTGDIAQEAESGIFRIVGRASRFSKIAGLRISLDEIEHLLAAHGIDATVAGDDEAIAVCLDSDELHDRALALIERNMSVPPRALILFAPAQLPRLASGKPDNQTILSTAKAIRAEGDWAAGSAHSSGLAAIYARALNRDVVMPEDSFASLGGDSLGYIEVSMAIETQLGFLPSHWERLSIAQIEQMAVHDGAISEKSGYVTVETEMLVRPVAMTSIVTAHVLGALPGAHNLNWLHGGAAALLMTAGYNLCRFQKGKLISASAAARWGVLTNFFCRILLPYYFFLFYRTIKAAFGAPPVAWSSYLLLDDYIRYPDAVPLTVYWFIGALFQCTLIMVVLFSIPKIREFALKSGFQLGVTLFIIAYAIKFAVHIALLPMGALMFPNNQLDNWAYAFVIGWMMAEARSPSERALCLAAMVATTAVLWGYFKMPIFTPIIAVALILYVPKTRVPKLASVPLTYWARSTYFIYLTHSFVMAFMRIPSVQALTGSSTTLIVTASVVLSTACGVCFYTVWRLLERGVGYVRRAYNDGEPPSDSGRRASPYGVSASVMP